MESACALPHGVRETELCICGCRLDHDQRGRRLELGESRNICSMDTCLEQELVLRKRIDACKGIVNT